MRIPRLFIDEPISAGSPVTLEGARAHYLRHVLRLREGDAISLFNGTGGEYLGFIEALPRHGAVVMPTTFSPVDRESPLSIHLGLAVIKREAMDAAIIRATELGVTEITPILTEFVSVPRNSLGKRVDHWQGIIRSACEQSGRNRVPLLNDPVPLANWMASLQADLRLFAHPGPAGRLAAIDASPTTVAVLVGPEGGLADAEIASVATAGFEEVGLGNRILRAETAPIALISLIQYRWGDFR